MNWLILKCFTLVSLSFSFVLVFFLHVLCSVPMVSLWWCRSCSDWFYVKSMRFSQHFECSRNDLIRSCCDRFQKAYHTPLASASCHKTQCNTARSDKRSFLGKTAVPQDAGAQWFEAIPGSSGTDWALAFFSWPGLRWGTLCCYSVWPRTGYQE